MSKYRFWILKLLFSFSYGFVMLHADPYFNSPKKKDLCGLSRGSRGLKIIVYFTYFQNLNTIRFYINFKLLTFLIMQWLLERNSMVCLLILFCYLINYIICWIEQCGFFKIVIILESQRLSYLYMNFVLIFFINKDMTCTQCKYY